MSANHRQSSILNDGLSIAIASAADRQQIAHFRHDVYAEELGQHAVNTQRELSDSLDQYNIVLVCRRHENITGFITLTPPGAPMLSLDKYFRRDQLPFAIDAGTYEVRLLTVLNEFRGSETASLLLYAAYRWVEAHQGQRIVAIGRREVVLTYRKIGLQLQGLSTLSGAVTYDLMAAEIGELRARLENFAALRQRLRQSTAWLLPFDFDSPSPCFHGGAFFTAIGERFDDLARANSIINADVLDAWYPPAPRVMAQLTEYLPWLIRTSPPTQCAGLVETIACARGVMPSQILPGAGSSDLIFRALRHWLHPASRVLLLDPTYGEYAHVLEKVIRCQVDRYVLDPARDFRLDPVAWAKQAAQGYDLVVLVNPNSPTGQHVDRAALSEALRSIPVQTRVWIDETYVDYAGTDQSLESFAAKSENLIVCKSMSKIYALSGLRVAYLCAAPHQLEALRAITPPWVVGLPAQLAAVTALGQTDYYRERIAETHVLRDELAAGLRQLGWRVLPGIANFLLCELPAGESDADQLIQMCREHGLFLRNPTPNGQQAGSRWIRIAVKDHSKNSEMLEILATCQCKTG